MEDFMNKSVLNVVKLLEKNNVPLNVLDRKNREHISKSENKDRSKYVKLSTKDIAGVWSGRSFHEYKTLKEILTEDSFLDKDSLSSKLETIEKEGINSFIEQAFTNNIDFVEGKFSKKEKGFVIESGRHRCFLAMLFDLDIEIRCLIHNYNDFKKYKINIFLYMLPQLLKKKTKEEILFIIGKN